MIVMYCNSYIVLMVYDYDELHSFVIDSCHVLVFTVFYVYVCMASGGALIYLFKYVHVVVNATLEFKSCTYLGGAP